MFCIGKQQSLIERRIGFVLTAILCVSFVGCGNNLARVTGVVTIDGQPLRGGEGVKATVMFQPQSGGAPAVGPIDENGRYELSTGSQTGIAAGKYQVSCTATQIIASNTPGGTPSGKRITDPKYASVKTSGLQFEVQPGHNQFDINLESSPTNTGRRARQ